MSLKLFISITSRFSWDERKHALPTKHIISSLEFNSWILFSYLYTRLERPGEPQFSEPEEEDRNLNHWCMNDHKGPENKNIQSLGSVHYFVRFL